jgi:hypothetical protein
MSKISKFLKFNVVAPESGKPKISFSQYSSFATCPKQWELTYARGNRIYDASIHTTFGTALHETIQEWLSVLYTQSVKAANAMDLPGFFKERLMTVYKDAREKMEGRHFSTPKELAEFYEDGIAILQYLTKKRTAYFSSKGWQLVGVEIPLYHPISEKSVVRFLGYIDVVLYDENKDEYHIIDIKTSTRGWNALAKADKVKISQLILYKEYFAQQFNVDPDKIHIKYFIVKRKLYEEAAFPQKRIQEFIPASGKPTRNKVRKEIEAFIESSFNEDGSYRMDREYLAIAGPKSKNCKFCVFAEDDDLCPLAKRIKE